MNSRESENNRENKIPKAKLQSVAASSLRRFVAQQINSAVQPLNV
jgi:hypothetical protein